MRRLLPLFALALLAACAPKSPAELGRHFSIQGVVTDLGTATSGAPNGDPLSGVKVTLISSDRLPPITTGADGAFLFSPVYQGDGLVLVFQKDGYAPVSKNLGDLIPFFNSNDGGCAICGPDGLSWTQPMYRRAASATLVGRVVASNTNKPLAGATVTLFSQDNKPAATTDANGFYKFEGLNQISGLRLSAAAAGFITQWTTSFNIDPVSTGVGPDGTIVVGYLQRPDMALGAATVISGIVTDQSTRMPLTGVKVTLVSPDNLPAVTTDATGAYKFTVYNENVNNGPYWTLEFSKDGWSPASIQVGNTGSCQNILLPSGVLQPTCIYNQSLIRAQGTLAGIVRFNALPAQGAIIQLCDLNYGASCIGQGLLDQKTIGADGRFSFPNLRIDQNYGISVLPWDSSVASASSSADGINDTAWFFNTYGPLNAGSSGIDFTNVAINLSAPSKDIVASSFVGFSYPWSGISGDNGVCCGYLLDPAATLFLHFNAPVDTSFATFELRKLDLSNGRYSAPLPITVTWDRTVVANIKPASPLPAFAEEGVRYELRITSLRWGDGTLAIAPAQQTNDSNYYYTVYFYVTKQPVFLTNPQPSLYLGNESFVIGGQVRKAASAAFDYSTYWLFDSNGDFISSRGAGTIDLQWPAVLGASRYLIFGRNTTSLGGGVQHSTEWVQLKITSQVVDPMRNPVVFDSVNPWAVQNGVPGPWGFNNAVEFAIVAQDVFGFNPPLDTTKIFSTADTFGGVANAVAVDTASSPGAFASIAERGNWFTKTVAVTFSEPMNGTSTPTLTLTSGANALVGGPLAFAWGDGANPSTNAPNTASKAWWSLQLQAKNNPCTEIVSARINGDILLPVRDGSIFAANSKIMIVQPALAAAPPYTGNVYAEATVASATQTVVTLTSPIVALPPAPNTTALNIPNGSLACTATAKGAAQATSGLVTQFPSGTIPAGTDLAKIPLAGSAAGFFIGQTVMVYEPPNGGLPAIFDVRSVRGVDTSGNIIYTASALTFSVTSTQPGHTANSIVFPLSGTGEAALRSTFDVGANVGLINDKVAGGVIDLSPTSSANGLGLLVGDLVLLDTDGDLTTTNDQVQAPVTAVVCTPNTPATVNNQVCKVTVGAPGDTTVLFQSRSKVIGLGDSFSIAGTRDTSGLTTLFRGAAGNNLGNQFTVGGTPLAY